MTPLGAHAPPDAMNDLEVPGRPLSVTIIGWIFVAFGGLALIGGSAWLIHMVYTGRTAELESQAVRELIPIGVTWVLALVGGVYLLRGQGWARWLLVAWASFHVFLSLFHQPLELALHALVLALIAYFLFKGSSSRFFRTAQAERVGALNVP